MVEIPDEKPPEKLEDLPAKDHPPLPTRDVYYKLGDIAMKDKEPEPIPGTVEPTGEDEIC